jgi:hypothetical protein
MAGGQDFRRAMAPITIQPIPRAPGLANFLGTYMESAVAMNSVKGSLSGEMSSIQDAIQYLDSTEELYIQAVIDEYTLFRAPVEDVYNRYFVKDAEGHLVFFVAECREFSRFSFLLCHESKHELICL